MDFRNTVLIMTSNLGTAGTCASPAWGFGRNEGAVTYER